MTNCALSSIVIGTPGVAPCRNSIAVVVSLQMVSLLQRPAGNATQVAPVAFVCTLMFPPMLANVLDMSGSLELYLLHRQTRPDVVIRSSADRFLGSGTNGHRAERTIGAVAHSDVLCERLDDLDAIRIHID